MMKSALKYCLLIIVVFVVPLSAQTLLSVDPDNAQRGESLGVAIVGSDTHFEQATYTIIRLLQGYQQIDAYSYYPYSDTDLIVWFDIPSDAEAGLHDLFIYNHIDGTMILDDCFTIGPGGIVSVSPTNAQQGQHLSVTITGQDTHFQQGSPFLQGSPTDTWLSQGTNTIYPKSLWTPNDTLLITEFDIPCGASTGLYDLYIDNDIDGTLVFYDGININPFNPSLTSITPRGAYQGQSLSVTITGQNTLFQAATTNFEQGSPTAGFCQGTPTFFDQGSPTTNTCAVWLSQGNSTIYANECWNREKTLLTATFDIPVDANTGLWDVHAPSFFVDDVLTLPDSFIIVQPGDWTGDGMVNFFDLAVVAEHWLEGTGE